MALNCFQKIASIAQWWPERRNPSDFVYKIDYTRCAAALHLIEHIQNLVEQSVLHPDSIEAMYKFYMLLDLMFENHHHRSLAQYPPTENMIRLIDTTIVLGQTFTIIHHTTPNRSTITDYLTALITMHALMKEFADHFIKAPLQLASYSLVDQ